jgi:hypothetical protein
MSTHLEEARLWVQSDEILSNLITTIEAQSGNDEEAALAMFNRISLLYQLPKKFYDITDEIYDAYTELDRQASCVLAELAVINYLEPHENIKNNVLVALYTVFLKERIDVFLAAVKHFGSWESVPTSFYVYYFGKDIDAHIKFDIPEGISWVDSGAVAMVLRG